MFSNNDESTRGITVNKFIFTLKYILKAKDCEEIDEKLAQIRSAPKTDYPIILFALSQKFSGDNQAKFSILASTMTDKEFIDRWCELLNIDPSTVSL